MQWLNETSIKLVVIMLVHLAITSLEVVEVRVRWNQLGIIIGIINMMLFVGILYYCYWDVQLFDGYLVSSIRV